MPDINALETMPARPALSATSDTPPPPELAPQPEARSDAAQEPPADENAPAAETPAAEGAEGEAGEKGPGEAAAAVREPTPAARSISTRMSELAAGRRAAEEARAAADARADKLAALVETLVADRTKAAEPTPAAPTPRPAREQFADPDSYDTALIEWASNQAATAAAQRAMEAAEQRRTEKAAAERTATETAAQQKQIDDLRTTYQEKRAKMIEEHPDFVEIAEGDFPVSETMVPPLLMAENGPAVLYYLGQHHDESARIAGLNPLQQAIEIGKIAARLSEAPRAQPSRLPPPIVPVGSRNGAAPKSPDEMSTEEYAAMRLPKLQAERTAGMWGRAKAN